MDIVGGFPLVGTSAKALVPESMITPGRALST